MIRALTRALIVLAALAVIVLSIFARSHPVTQADPGGKTASDSTAVIR